MKRLAVTFMFLLIPTLAVSPVLAASSLVKVSPKRINFGTQPAGTKTSAEVTVTNTSSMSLYVLVDGNNLTDDFNFGNVAGSTCIAVEGQVLAPGESCIAVLEFNPSPVFAGEHQTGRLLVTVRDPSSGALLESVSVPVRGIGK